MKGKEKKNKNILVLVSNNNRDHIFSPGWCQPGLKIDLYCRLFEPGLKIAIFSPGFVVPVGKPGLQRGYQPGQQSVSPPVIAKTYLRYVPNLVILKYFSQSLNKCSKPNKIYMFQPYQIPTI